MLKKLTEDVERPYAVVLGGAKVSDKLGVIDHLLEKADRILVGGGMVYTFLKAQGHEVGKLAAPGGPDPGRAWSTWSGPRPRAWSSCCPSTSSVAAEFPDLKTKAPAHPGHRGRGRHPGRP